METIDGTWIMKGCRRTDPDCLRSPEDLLELIEEPREIEEDGKTFVVGMTYSDLEILLNHYETITEFIRIGKKKKDSTIF